MHEHLSPISGMVYIVGGGPGDPGLITVKGLECLRRADVVLYDRLIAQELLNEVPTRAELIDVGKEPKRHRRSQDEINSLLIEKAREGKTVVRLKGGDPFVFGRGGEECLALAEAGVRYEVVPGVSSASTRPRLSYPRSWTRPPRSSNTRTYSFPTASNRFGVQR